MIFFLMKVLVSFNLSFFHPFYVSVIDINHNNTDKTVEVSIRIFADDVETTLKNFSNKPVDLLNANKKELNNTVLEAYINKQLKLTIDDKAVALDYLGFEIIKESVWIYVEVANINQFKKLGVTCQLLYDFNKQQMNIVHVKKQIQEKSYKLDYPNSYVSFGF